MYVTVNLHDTLREYAYGQPRVEMMLIDGSTVWDAALATGVPENELGVCVGPKGFLDPFEPIQEGLTITLYPPILGG